MGIPFYVNSVWPKLSSWHTVRDVAIPAAALMMLNMPMPCIENLTLYMLLTPGLVLQHPLQPLMPRLSIVSLRAHPSALPLPYRMLMQVCTKFRAAGASIILDGNGPEEDLCFSATCLSLDRTQTYTSIAAYSPVYSLAL